MSKFLQVIWICKVILTSGTAYRYCSETVFSPFCCISVFYSVALFLSIFVTCQNRNGFVVVDEQESLHLQRLEEGFHETFIGGKQNGEVDSSIRTGEFQWQDPVKEKYS